MNLTREPEVSLLVQIKAFFNSMMVGKLQAGGDLCLRSRCPEFESLYELNQGEEVLIKQAACCPSPKKS